MHANQSTRFIRLLTIGTALAGVAACVPDGMGGPDGASAVLLESAFSSAPAGLDLVTSSFETSGGTSVWDGPMRGGRGAMGGMGGPGMRGPGMGAFMGGGLGADFMGAGAGGRHANRGPFAVRLDSTCAFASATGDVTCGPTVRNGLTVTSVYTIRSASGAVQSAVDSVTTNSVRTRTTVSGTSTRGRDTTEGSGSVTATVNHRSDRTVTGLAASSTQRTVNGWSEASESARGTNREGQAFTSVRASSDTTTGLVIPVSNASTANYPTAGKVVRRMKVVTTIDGTSASRERREEVTYDGTATAKVIITENGTTRSCTMALPRGRPVCP